VILCLKNVIPKELKEQVARLTEWKQVVRSSCWMYISCIFPNNVILWAELGRSCISVWM